MRFSRLVKVGFALAGAVMLTAPSASAHNSHTTTFTVANNATNAYSNTTSSIIFGAYEMASAEIDPDAGVKIAHASGSEVTPAPNNGDLVGEGTATAKWTWFFCASSTQDLDAYWDTDLSAAPSGIGTVVSHIRLVNAIGFTTHVWVVEENDAADDYKMVITDGPDEHTCSSQTNASSNLTTYGSVPGSNPARHPGQNPSTSGCYAAPFSFTDPSGGSHSGTASAAIGTGSC